MGVAARIGLSLQEFWLLTPFEFGLVIKAHDDRSKQEREERIVSSYMTASFQRFKKMPDLKKLLEQSNPKTRVKQSPEQMLAMIKKAHAANGGTTIN